MAATEQEIVNIFEWLETIKLVTVNIEWLGACISWLKSRSTARGNLNMVSKCTCCRFETFYKLCKQWRRQGGGGKGGQMPPQIIFCPLRATKGYTSVLSLSENVWLISCHYSLVNARIHETVFYSFNISL